MDVVAFLPRQLFSHLKVVLGSEHTLLATSQWAELLAAVRTAGPDLVVADPTTGGDAGVGTIEQLRREFPSLQVVVYTQLAPASIKAVVRLAKVGVEHVVISRFDDEPKAFRQLLESIPAGSLGDRMLQELAEPLAALPITVVRAVEQLFHTPARFKNARDLADAAGMNLRTLYRNLEPAGIYSARALVVSARILRAFAYLRDPGRSIKDVAAKAGYHSPWQLTQQMRELTGETTEEARRALSGDDLVRRLAVQVRRRRRKR